MSYLFKSQGAIKTTNLDKNKNVARATLLSISIAFQGIEGGEYFSFFSVQYFMLLNIIFSQKNTPWEQVPYRFNNNVRFIWNY